MAQTTELGGGGQVPARTARSTVCGWHAERKTLVHPLILATWEDALTASYLCIDATGVLVLAFDGVFRPLCGLLFPYVVDE